MTDYLKLAQETAPPPEDEANNPYLALAQEDQAQQQVRARSVLELALKDKPDVAAERQRLAQTSGLPLRVVERNLDEIRVKEQARAIDLVRMMQDSPVLARQLTDPAFATTAVDDLDTLTKIERAVGHAVRYMMGADGKGGLQADLPGFATDLALGGTAGVGKALFDITGVVYDALGADNWAAEMRGRAKRAQESMDFYGSQNDSSTGKAVKSGLQSAGTNLAAMPLGLERGLFASAEAAATAVTAWMGAGVGSGAYNQARDEGKGKVGAAVFGIPQGVFEYVFEKIPASKLFGDIAANTGLLKTLRTQALSEGWTEQVTTLAQDFNEWMNLNPEKTLGDFIAERPEAAYQTFIATLVGVGVQTTTIHAINKIVEKASDQRLQFQQDAFSELMKLAGGSALRERSPEQFRQHMEVVVGQTDGASKSIFVDGQVLNQLPEEVLAQLPESVRAQIPDAALGNGTVEIPIADVLTIAPGTPLEQVLNDNARMTPDAMSRADAVAAGDKAEVLKQEAQRVIEQAQDQQAAQAEYDAVHAMYRDQLTATGRVRPAVADMQAHWIASFYTAYGSRTGMTAGEFQQRYPLRVAGAPSAGAGQVMGQGKVGEITVEGYHFSKEDRTVISTGAFGTGLQGSSKDEYLNAADRRLAKRSYFYADKGTGIRPESGVGGRAHRVNLANVYDSNLDPQGLKKGPGGKLGFESRVLDAGFGGYLDRLEGTQPGQVVMLGDQTFQPELLGAQSRIETGKRVPALQRREAQWKTQASGAPEQLQARLERMQANPSWADRFDMKIEGGDLLVREKGGVFEQSVTLRNGKETLRKYGLTPGKKYKTREVAAALEARQRAKYGQIAPEDRSPESAKKIAKWMAEEVLFEVQQPGASGVGWYSEKFQKALDVMAEEFPELATDKQARDLVTALIAITSDGQKVHGNFTQALGIYQAFKDTGKFTTDRGHQRQASINGNLENLQRLYETFGPEKLHAYLLQEMSIGQLKKLAAAQGVELSSDYQVAVKMPMGVIEFGPKLGAFYANLMGAHGYLTMDRWWSRTFNRYRGTLLDAPTRAGLDRFKELMGDPTMSDDAVLSAVVAPRDAYAARGFKNGTEIEKAANTIYKAALEALNDAPFNATDRTFMLDAVNRAQKVLARSGVDITVADIQAALWYYEKRLYGELGARQTADTSYEDAARRVVAERAGRSAGQDVQSVEPGLDDFEVGTAGGVLEQSAATGRASLNDFSKQGLNDLLSKDGWAVLTAEDPGAQKASPEANAAAMKALEGDLAALGAEWREVVGKYGDTQKSLIVSGITEQQAFDLGAKYGQESILTREGLVYMRDGSVTPATGMEVYDTPPADFYTTIPGTDTYFSISLDWGGEQAAEVLNQTDLFPGEFATKRTTVTTRMAVDSKGTLAKGGNVNSKGQQVTATKQGLQRFWNWFEGSEATDDKDRPLVLYHSTNSDVTQFETNRETTNSYGILGEMTVRRAGIFLTPDLKFSQEYLRDGAGQNVMQVYAALKNPLDLRRGISERVEAELEAAGVNVRYVNNVQNVWELFDSADDGTNEFVDALKVAGYDGAIFREDSPTGESEGGTTYVAFESSQVKSATGNRGAFDANDPNILKQQARGTFNPRSLELVLNPNANLSTWFHETGHFFLEVMADIASQPNAPAQIVEDMGTFLKWAGVADLAAWNALDLDGKRQYHERWAESIEQYVMEGKAPSVELQPLMRRFAAWLKSVYGSIQKFLAARGQAISGPVLGQADDSEAQADAVYSGIANDQEMIDALEVYMVSGNPPEGALNDKLLAYINRLPPVPADSYLTFYRNQPSGARPWDRGWSSWTINEDQTRYFGGRDFEVLKRKGVHGLDLNRLGEYRTRVTGEYSQYGSQGEWLVLNESVFNQDPNAEPGQFNAPLNDDIRRVMDRMLATDEQIAQANEVAGLVPDEAADALAAERLNKRSMADLKWAVRAFDQVIAKLQKQAKAIEKEVRAVITTEVDATPEMRAKRALDALAVTPEYAGLLAEHKAARKAAEATAREEVKAALLGENPDAKGLAKGQLLMKNKRDIDNKVDAAMIKWDQANPTPKRSVNATDADAATIADSFEFESVDAMMQAIDAFGSRKDAIDGLTDRRMLEEHGDLIDDAAIRQAANEAVHNEARARSLATELRTQGEMLNARADTGQVNAKGSKITVNALMAAAKQFGANVVARTPLRDLKAKAWQHTAAERRAGKRWQEATAAGKTQEAVQAKQDQMLQHAAATAALDAQAESKKIGDFFKRVLKGNDETVVEKGRDPDIVNAARSVLAAYGLQSPASKGAQAYLEALQRHDEDTWTAVAPMVAAATQNAQPLDALTFEELQGLHESIQAMWHLAKESRTMEVNGDKLDLDDVQDELYDRLEEIGIPDVVPGELEARTAKDDRSLLLKQAGALLRRVEQWAEGIDGKHGGPFLKYTFQVVKKAADKYRTERTIYRKKFMALVDNIVPTLTGASINAPELGYNFKTGADGIGMGQVLHAILHTGNESNKRKLLLGRGWATENPDGTLNTGALPDGRAGWDAFIARLVNEGTLKPEHFAFAQGVWDLLEETKPGAQKTHRDVFGRFFAEVTADAFVDPFGVQRRGGYVPAQTDPRLVKDRQLAEKENAGMAYAFPAPGKGFTMARVEYNKPLMLDLRTLPQHIDKVLLFTHMTPATRGVKRLLSRPKVNQPLNRIDPAAIDTMLDPWLARSAQQIVETPVVGAGKWARIPSIVRARAGMGLMFANVSNTLQQITGFSTALVKVRPGPMTRALAQYVAHPVQTGEAVRGSSKFMAQRASNEIAVLSDTMEKILLKPSVYERAEMWTREHAYFMQSAFDNVMGPIIWTGAFNQGVADGMTDDQAADFADGVIRTTQGSTLPEDVSRFETGPAYARVFTQFIGYFNMLANTNATAIKQIAGEVGLKKGAGRALGVVFVGMLMPIWVAEAIAVAFKGGPDDEDKDGYLDDWLAAVFGFGTVKGMFAQVPIVGMLGQRVVNSFNDNPADDKFSLSPAVSILESAGGSPTSVYKAIVDDGNAQKAVRDVAALVSIATGAPALAIARPVGYAAGVAQGRIQPTSAADAVRGLVTGTASPESKVK